MLADMLGKLWYSGRRHLTAIGPRKIREGIEALYNPEEWILEGRIAANELVVLEFDVRW